MRISREHFGRFEGDGQEVDEEVTRRQCGVRRWGPSATIVASRDRIGGWIVGGGVGMGERAADRAAIADLPVTDHFSGRRQ